MSLKDDKTRISVVTTKDVKKKLQAKADKESRSLSHYISLLLEKHVKK